jgi:asparagine synthase (glutamine-hydrolysing)
MCGIAGLLNVTSSRPPTTDDLSPMIRILRHRGPDDTGFYTDQDIGLAHARLSIIDLSGGKQPLCNEDKTIWVAFNGEIFNYIELRRDLVVQGHKFTTQSDTEVIVHLYEQYGDDFVDHLNGQFAIAIWDRKNRRLVLARDRVGIRPLFYTTANGWLIFSSEIKSILVTPGVTRRLNRQALAETLTFWSVLPPATLFEGVSCLPPGHLMTVNLQTGAQAIRQYWDWDFPVASDNENRSTDDYAEELRTLLIDAVRLQLRADVPVGAYLSGGLDSSIITAFIKNYTNSPLRTFSIAFEDAEFDESDFQRQAVEHLETHHTQVRCAKTDICQAFPRTIWHTESVILRTAPTPLMLLSATVRAEGYRVVLTGEGADEVFGGYDIFKEAKVRRFWARQPDSKIRPLILDRLYPYLVKSPTSARGFAQSFFRVGQDTPSIPYFGHLPRWSTTRRAWRFFSRDLAESLRGWEPYDALEKTLPQALASWPPLCRDQYIEAHTLMSGYLLCSQGDRMAMANSIEGRFPYLDHRVIQFANALPPRYKVMGLQEKYLLRRATGHLLPPALAQRPKQPYRAPDSQSFFRDGAPADYVAELFRAERLRNGGLFDPDATLKLFDKCRRGQAIGFSDNMAFVGILSTLLIEELFLRPSSFTDAFAGATPLRASISWESRGGRLHASA